MKIQEAVEALEQGKVINSANERGTIKAIEKEGVTWVCVTRKVNGQDEESNFRLSRFRQLFRVHDFALGPYKLEAPEKGEKTEKVAASK